MFLRSMTVSAFCLALAAPAAAATPLITISIPVQLANIDRAFDSFSVGCQLQWTNQMGATMTANMDNFAGKLVNRGFNGTIAVTYSGSADNAQSAKRAVCQLGLFSSTNASLGYRPGTDDAISGNGIPDAYKPKPNAPFTAIITVQL